MSFRRRLALTCAAAVAVAVLLGSAVAYVVVRDTLRDQIDGTLRRAAAAQAATGRIALAPPGAQPEVQPLEEAPVFSQLVAPAAASAPFAGVRVQLASDGDIRAVASGMREPFFADRRVDGVHVRVYTALASPGVVRQLARPLTEVDGALARLRLGLGLVALAGIALAVVLARLATRTAVRPVAQLTETAEHVARTRDLSRRIEAAGGDEVARLAASFNTMLEALDASRRAQRRLVADASHELRTPLTSLRTNLEVLGSAGALPEADRERLRSDLVAQLEELSELVADLIDLARDDEPEPGAAEEVRLDELVEHAVARARRHAPDVRFAIELEPALVRGVPARIDRAVGNLLDNAAKWSPRGGTVEVRLREGELAVRDHGAGIAPEDLPHVFDRFYRSAAARGRAGSGLGLAIVRRVAEAHGGSVSAGPAPGGGALLRLALPAGKAVAPALPAAS